MKNPKLIFAVVLGVVVCFAGYNVWSYFIEQQAIQAEEDRLAEERRIAREEERERKAAEKEAQRLAAEQAAREAEEQRKADREAEREARRLEREAATRAHIEQRERDQAARLAEIEREQQQALKKAFGKARTTYAEYELNWDLVEYMERLSPGYVRDNPAEFLELTFEQQKIVNGNPILVAHDETTSLMLYAGVGNDKVVDALLDIGMDPNAANAEGFTALMFAAAYGSPKTVELLVEHGADLAQQSKLHGITALHVAALRNPNPEMVKTLVELGHPLEIKSSEGMTALYYAAASNPNMEVPVTLVQIGADKEAYGAGGETPHAVAMERVRGVRMNTFTFIAPGLGAELMEQLKP